MLLTQDTLNGLSFPSARVIYSSGHHSATIVRDGKRYSARVPYDHADRSASRCAAVWKAAAKMHDDGITRVSPETHTIVWGDLADAYVALLVDNDLLAP